MTKLISQQSVKEGGWIWTIWITFEEYIFVDTLDWIILLFERRILLCKTKDSFIHLFCLERRVKPTDDILLTLCGFVSNPS